jgi:hypothetical protein
MSVVAAPLVGLGKFLVISTAGLVIVAGPDTAAAWSGTVVEALGTTVGLIAEDAGSIDESIQQGRDAANQDAPAAPAPAQ